MFRNLRAIGLACAATVWMLSPAAIAGDWFLHNFGELRSYHSDWLNVCGDSGKGQCRSVQIPLKAGGDPFFGASRLAVIRLDDGSHAIEVYVAGMPDRFRDPISFSFANEEVKLKDNQWRWGAYASTNVAEMFTLEDASTTVRLVKLIREKNTLSVSYTLPDGNKGGAKFSLRGSATALNAIERHVASINGS